MIRDLYDLSQTTNRPVGLYLDHHLSTASEVTSRLWLHPANWHQLILPRCRLNTDSILMTTGLTAWSYLSGELRDLERHFDSFKQFLKTVLFILY